MTLLRPHSPATVPGFLFPGEPMSQYHDDWQSKPLPTATVWEDTKTTRVTYRGDDGSKFRVIVRQLPNAVGFRAQLPGDGKKAR